MTCDFKEPTNRGQPIRIQRLVGVQRVYTCSQRRTCIQRVRTDLQGVHTCIQRRTCMYIQRHTSIQL